MEFVVAEVQRSVDGLERFKVNVDLAFFSFRGQDFTTVHDQAIRRNLVVQLETLLGRRNGGQDGLSVDTGLDVRGSTLRGCQQTAREKTTVANEGYFVRILQPTSWQFATPDSLELRQG